MYRNRIDFNTEVILYNFAELIFLTGFLNFYYVILGTLGFSVYISRYILTSFLLK